MTITVIGAGIIGCSVAFELASRGAHVEVIDMRGPGLGATQASAGMLAPYAEAHGGALLELGTASLAGYDRFIERVRQASGRTIEYRRNGSLHVASSGDGCGQLEATAGRLAELGVDHSLLDAAAIKELEPELSAQRLGLLIPAHGYVKVGDLMFALEAAAAALGVRFTTRRIDDVDADAPGSDFVVMAAGSWSSLLHPPLPVKPIRGQVVELRRPAALLSRVVWGEGCYLVPWCSGAMIVGATSEDAGFDESPTDAGVTQLLDAAFALVPAAAPGPDRSVRAGLRPATADELPLIGLSPTMRRVVVATGHYRNGILLAPLTATLVADLVEGREDPMLALVRPGRLAR